MSKKKECEKCPLNIAISGLKKDILKVRSLMDLEKKQQFSFILGTQGEFDRIFRN
ncbi:MAG: hypothetical protein M3R27_08930 [Bacteroidota bacterium]|nr:hypothetical protein [Bacteroidota bacterium]